MSAIIKQLTDKEGANDLLPITNTKAVYDDAGNRLDNTLTNLTNLVNNKASANLVSDAYNPSRNYSTGELCIYMNTLWKSKVNSNTGNTPAEGSYWTATNCGNELKKQSTYSTDEQVVGTWIGENPIYRKVITLNLSQPVVGRTVDRFDLPNIKLLNVEGYVEYINDVGDESRLMLNTTNFVNDTTQSIYMNLGIIHVGANLHVYQYSSSIPAWARNCSSIVAHLILEYTKTTD